MKKQNFPIGVIMIAASMLIYSCSNNDTAQSDANMVSPNNAVEDSTKAAVDSIAKTNEQVAGKEEKEEKEEDEKKEK